MVGSGVTAWTLRDTDWVDWSLQSGFASQATYCYDSLAETGDPFEDYRLFQYRVDTNGSQSLGYGASSECGTVTDTNMPSNMPWQSFVATGLICLQGQTAGLYSGSSVPGSGTFGSGSLSANVHYILNTTGGRSMPGRRNLLGITANASDVVATWYPGGIYEWLPGAGLGLNFSAMDYQAVTIMGQTEDSDGTAIVIVPAGEEIEATPRAIKTFYAVAPTVTNLPTPQIYFNGSNVTDKTVSVSVGQQINLTCSVTNVPDELLDCNWNIPGTTFSNYTATINAGTLITDFPTNTNDVTFYWADGATNRTMTCTWTNNLDNIWSTCKTTFNVNRPNATIIPTITGVIAVDSLYTSNNSVWLHFGGYADSNRTVYVPGITFQITNEDMPGSYFFVQTGIAVGAHTANDARYPYVSETNGPGLDGNRTNWIYPFFISTNATSDSPAQPCLPRYTSVTRNDSFSMYLVYSNCIANSLPVALQVVNWSWSATATNEGGIGGPVWQLSGTPTPSNSPPTNIFLNPQWTNNIKNYYELP
jgi:hypothetical protein